MGRLINPAANAAASQVSENLSGQPTIVNGRLIEGVPMQTDGFEIEIAGADGPKSQPLLMPVALPLSSQITALPSELLGHIDES